MYKILNLSKSIFIKDNFTNNIFDLSHSNYIFTTNEGVFQDRFEIIYKVEDIVEIMNYGVMSTPALVVDGIVKSSGKLLSIDEIINLLNKFGEVKKIENLINEIINSDEEAGLYDS